MFSLCNCRYIFKQKIAEEPVLNIDFKNHITRNIELIHTNNVIQATAKKLKIFLYLIQMKKYLLRLIPLQKVYLRSLIN